MASTVFQDYNPATPIVAAWLNDVNTSVYTTVPAQGAAITTLNAEVAALQNNAQIQPVSASVALNALTATLNPAILSFRSATLASGTVTSVTTSSPVSVVVPNGATLGMVSGVAGRLVLLALNNGGTVSLGIVNLSGGNNLDETTVVSTTAISASATSASVVYSPTALTNVPFRVVGVLSVSEVTAGTWAVAPTLVQGTGGQAFAALNSLGYGQVYSDQTANRAFGANYYNTTGRPMLVSVYILQTGTSASARLLVNGTVVSTAFVTATNNIMAQAIVPPGAVYQIPASSGTYGLASWIELS